MTILALNIAGSLPWWVYVLAGLLIVRGGLRSRARFEKRRKAELARQAQLQDQSQAELPDTPGHARGE